MKSGLMANDYFRFKQFTIKQGQAGFKVTTDSVLLGAWADLAEAETILDIGTGTGILALMAAQRSNALITAIEPDSGSFSQALSNFASSKWSDRIRPVNMSIQQFAINTEMRFDAIITNPPYFTSSLLNPDPRKAMARHNTALPPEELIANAEQLLTDKGQLHLVMPADAWKYFIAIAEKESMYCQRILKILPKPTDPPKRLLLSFGRKKITSEESSLVIETGVRHHYSDEYKSLTDDFYLEK